MRVKKWIGLVLAVCLALMPAVASAEQRIPRFGANGGTVAAAFGEYFLFFDPADPTDLSVIDARTGDLKAFLVLGEDSGASEGLWIRVTDTCALIQTPRYAYRMNSELRVEARVPIPELPGRYSITESLERLIYQDMIHITWLNLTNGYTERILEGSYDTLPQQIYSNPVFLTGETRILLYENIGSEIPVPAVYDLESETLISSDIQLDMDSDWEQSGDCLLIVGGLLAVRNDAPDGTTSETQERVSGLYEPATGDFVRLSLPLTGYGVQGMGASERCAAYFEDVGMGWRLCRLTMDADRAVPDETFTAETANVELLAVTDSGRVLYRTFDCQTPDSLSVGYFVA